MTAPTIRAAPKKALDQRATSRHDNALATSLDASAILGPEFPESVRKMSDERQFASARLRNRDFTLDVLRGVRRRRVSSSKIANGSGEHIVHFARNFPTLIFQP